MTIADKRGGAVGTRKTEPSKGNRVAEAFDRSVKVRGLADGTQEAIIEQTFAKFGKVKLVILKQGANEAIVEFENGQVGHRPAQTYMAAHSALAGRRQSLDVDRACRGGWDSRPNLGCDGQPCSSA